jgi:3-phenylpropionate/trans-cinnamate dioxygenase ferredoxin subunit
MTPPDANAPAGGEQAGGELAGWHAAGPADEIPVEGALVIALKPPVAVFRLEDGFYATDDTCTHAQSSLAEGYIEDGTVECEFHFAKFDIRTGKALTPPAVIPLATYPVATRDGIVYVDLRGRAGCPIEQLSPGDQVTPPSGSVKDQGVR